LVKYCYEIIILPFLKKFILLKKRLVYISRFFGGVGGIFLLPSKGPSDLSPKNFRLPA